MDRFPFPCRIGAPLSFGRSKAVLARLVVPSADLIDLHAEVYRLCLPHLHPGPMANVLPGQMDSARDDGATSRSRPGGSGVANRGEPLEMAGSVIGLRRWNGDEKLEYPIS